MREQYADAGDRYLLSSRIATGGMGVVWRGRDLLLDREIAVKVLKAEFADDALFRSRFADEARHAAALQHPNIAALFDVGETPGTDISPPRPFLVMELVDGQPLNNLLRPDAPMDPAVVADLMAQAADALGAAHRAGIVHRDVKPGNLLVTPERRVKITDFGIARAAESVALTQTGQVMGTPQYLSPEQATGQPATAASDVYSLACVAYECLAGRRAFQAETAVATALAHVREPVPALPAFVPADLAAVVTRALAKDPTQRFPDGDAFAEALRTPGIAAIAVDEGATQVFAATDPSTRVLPVIDAADGPAASTVPEPAQAPPTQDSRSSMVWWLLALVVALLVLVFVLWRTVYDDSSDPDVPPTEPSVSQTPTPSESPTADASVDVNEDAYVGRHINDVIAELAQLGLHPDRQPIANPGGEPADSVIGVTPSGSLERGTRVTVRFWGPVPEEPSESPTPTPSPSPTPKPSATPTPTPTVSPTTPAPSVDPTDVTERGAVR